MDRRLTLALLLVALVAAVIGAAYIARPQPQPSDKLTIVTTFYPITYFAEVIGGERVRVTTLIPPGVEPHSWQPSAEDLVACSDAGIIFYNGAGLDDWLREDIVPSIDAGRNLVKELQILGNKAPIYMLSSAGDSLAQTVDFSELGLTGIFQKPIIIATLLKTLKTKLE